MQHPALPKEHCFLEWLNDSDLCDAAKTRMKGLRGTWSQAPREPILIRTPPCPPIRSRLRPTLLQTGELSTHEIKPWGLNSYVDFTKTKSQSWIWMKTPWNLLKFRTRKLRFRQDDWLLVSLLRSPAPTAPYLTYHSKSGKGRGLDFACGLAYLIRITF